MYSYEDEIKKKWDKLNLDEKNRVKAYRDAAEKCINNSWPLPKELQDKYMRISGWCIDRNLCFSDIPEGE